MQPEFLKYLNLIRRRKELFIVLALLMMTAVFTVSYLLPRKYEASCTVFVEKKMISDLVQGLAVTPSVEETMNVLTIAITSRPLVKKVVEALQLVPDRDKARTDELINRMQNGTAVKVKERNLLTISYVDTEPRVARDYVNTLVRFYVQENASSVRGETSDATNFLSGQMGAVVARLKKNEAEVNAYKAKNGGILSIDEGQLLEEINNSQQRLYDLQLRRRQLEGMRQLVSRGPDRLQARLDALQNRLDELRLQYTDGYPEVVAVKGDIESVKEQLRNRNHREARPLDPLEAGRIEAEIAAIRTTEDGLSRFIASNRKVMQEIPAARTGLETLELEQRNQRALYDQLSNRRGQSELSQQIEGQDQSTVFRVITPAQLPVKPASPDRLRLMLIGIAGSLAGSFGVLMLLDQMDGTMKDVPSVKALGVPLLAVIPTIEEPLARVKAHRRFQRLALAAGVYFLVMLCFPAMELLRLPYMDNLLDGLSSPRPISVRPGAR